MNGAISTRQAPPAALTMPKRKKAPQKKKAPVAKKNKAEPAPSLPAPSRSGVPRRVSCPPRDVSSYDHRIFTHGAAPTAKTSSYDRGEHPRRHLA